MGKAYSLGHRDIRAAVAREEELIAVAIDLLEMQGWSCEDALIMADDTPAKERAALKRHIKIQSYLHSGEYCYE